MARVHEEYIQQFLDRNKGRSFLGSELIIKLKRKFPEVTDANSKSILSRSVQKNMISCSKPIVFANKQYAYYSNKSHGGYSVLSNTIREFKPALHRALYALERNNGILTKNDLCKISGVTTTNGIHSTSYDALVEDLKTLQLANITRWNDTEYILLKNRSLDEKSLEKICEEQKRDNLILYLSLQWLVRSNLIDSRDLCFKGEANNYSGVTKNNEILDAFGFSNAVGIGSRAFQTMVLIDFSPNHCYEEYDFEGFKQRIDRTIYSVKKEYRKVLPIIISREFSPNAYAKIKGSGYLHFKIKSILGDNVFDVSQKYIRNTESINQKMNEKNSDFYNEVLESLAEIRKSGNETNYGNLKGQLFEYLMYPVIHKIFSNCLVVHSYSGSVDNEKFECDYLVRTQDEDIIIELKGYKKDSIILKGEYDQKTSKYTPNSVLWFLNKTFALCSKKLGKHPVKKFCYITTADFEESAKKELLIRKKNKPTILEPFYNNDSLIDFLSQHGMENEIKVIQQFYS